MTNHEVIQLLMSLYIGYSVLFTTTTLLYKRRDNKAQKAINARFLKGT